MSGAEHIPNRWSMRQRDWAMAAWVAFLSASFGTLIIFALLDPDEFTTAWSVQWEIGRLLGYSLGFAFLFVVSFLASGLTVFMIRSGPRQGYSKGRDQKPVPATHDPAKNNPDLEGEEWN
jgi:hypothetical protein